MATNRRQSPSKADEAARSISQWRARGRESLVLSCNSLYLDATGSVDELAERVYNHYHPAVTENENDSDDDNKLLDEINRQLELTTTPEASPKTKDSDTDTDDDENEDSPHSRKRGKNDGDTGSSSEQNTDGDAGNKAIQEKGDGKDPEDKSTQEYQDDVDLAAAALEASHNNAVLIKTLFDKVGQLNSGSEITIAELKALRSEIVRQKKNRPK